MAHDKIGGMKSLKTPNGYLLVFELGEDFFKLLLDWCERTKVTAGWLSAIGSFRKAELAYYDLAAQSYQPVEMEDTMEIASLAGTLATDEGKPQAHFHCVLSDSAGHAYGGHLVSATVGPTCEAKVEVWPQTLKRQHDQTTGLKLLDI
jgi:uncharacterized protein